MQEAADASALWMRSREPPSRENKRQKAAAAEVEALRLRSRESPNRENKRQKTAPPADLLTRVPTASGSEWSFTGLHSRVIDLVAIPNKGMGAIAVRDIAAGEILFVDPPLLAWFQDATESRDSNLKRLHASLELLDTADTRRFWDLMQASNYGPEKTALGVFLSNAYPLSEVVAESYDEQPDVTGAAVFACMSRLNHACDANAEHAWSEEAQCQIVRAKRAVAAREEISLNYIQLPPEMEGESLPRSPRRAYLRENFGFDCNCAACRR